MRRVVFGIGIVLVFIGCVQRRDYTGVRDGHFGVDVKRSFGPGREMKDYYVIEGGEGIVKNDTKDEVFSKLGEPDSIAITLEGYEAWTYEVRKLELLFKDGYLKEWRER